VVVAHTDDSVEEVVDIELEVDIDWVVSEKEEKAAVVRIVLVVVRYRMEKAVQSDMNDRIGVVASIVVIKLVNSDE
jgi:hypothetical protein